MRDEDSVVATVAAVGPFFNVSLRPERLAREVLAEASAPSYGTDNEGAGEALLAELEDLYQRATAAEAEDPGIGDAARGWSLNMW